LGLVGGGGGGDGGNFLTNIKLFSVTCLVRFLLTFELWESILPHPVQIAGIFI